MSNKKQYDNSDLFKNITQPAKNDADNDKDLDAELNISKKKHRNTIQVFDNYFQNITHPFVLIILCLIVVIIFLVLRYTSLHIKIAWIEKAAKDVEAFIGYFFTVVITYVITTFLENIKRISRKENNSNS